MKVRVKSFEELQELAIDSVEKMNDVVLDFPELYWFKSMENWLPKDRVIRVQQVENGLYYIDHPEFRTKYISFEMFEVI